MILWSDVVMAWKGFARSPSTIKNCGWRGRGLQLYITIHQIPEDAVLAGIMFANR